MSNIDITKVKTQSAINLREALNLRNMSQSELSRATGIDKGSISCYLSGRYTFKSDKAKLMADILHVSPVWLMGFDVPMEVKQREVPAGTPQKEIMLLLSQLSPDDQSLLLEMIKSFVSSRAKQRPHHPEAD